MGLVKDSMMLLLKEAKCYTWEPVQTEEKPKRLKMIFNTCLHKTTSGTSTMKLWT